jgi:hypothetical protein
MRSRLVFLLMSEDHGYVIGARPGPSFAHPIHVLSLAGVAGGIIILSVVRRCRDQYAIAIDVDVGRGRATPGETRRINSIYLFLPGAEGNRPGSRRRSGCAVSGGRRDRGRHGRACLKETDCRTVTLRRLVGVKAEVVECAPANRIRVLVLCKGFRAPGYGIRSLVHSPRSAAVALVVKRAIVRPTGLLRRRMKFDVTDVRPGPEGHTKGLDRAIQVHVTKSILIVPNTGTWISHFVTHKPNPVVVWTWFKLVHCGARRYPGLNGGLHPNRATDRGKVEISGAGDMELAVRGIVKHVALIRMRLAPGVLVWTKISGFAKIGRTRILCRVQVADINPDPVRHAVVMVASVIVGARWKGSGKRIDPGARADAGLAAIQA